MIEHLEEILDDLKFAKDPKNDIVIWINDNSTELEAKVRERYAIDGLMIRAHVDRGHLMIIGKAAAPVAGVAELVQQLSGFEAKSHVSIAPDTPSA